MKLKEIDRNGNVAWSPRTTEGVFLAVGTASQQPDSAFSTNAQLEIFKYNPSEKNVEMPISASIPSDSKFSKLLWGNAQHNNGVIVGGTENGAISIYDATQLLINRKTSKVDSSRIAILKEHKGSINAMDFNKFKTNLLATGSSDSDIYIWDLDKLEEPMTPGNKTQPLEDILSLAWNHKVQHILASTSTHRCQIWDLRKSDPVIKLSDSQMKMKCKKVVWHPDISTRLCISSEDDQTPIIQLWDLRYIQCPFHTLQKHTKGIVDIDWCLDDSDILMSVGKDRQMICWNMSTHNLSNVPNTSSDVIYEWQLDQDYINEARFCPKHPGLVSISSSDCHIGIYSLLGGRGHVSRELSDTVTDSFPLDLNDDNGQESELIKKEVEKAVELQLAPTPSLLKAPKWLKRSVGARFSFGGKLIQFYKCEDSRSRNNSESQMTPSAATNEGKYKVIISQIVTDVNIIRGSKMLLVAVETTDSLLNYCHDKVESITNNIVDLDSGDSKSELIFDRSILKFIGCHLEEDSRSAFMTNLGYSEANLKNIENFSKQSHSTFIKNEYDEINTDQFSDNDIHDAHLKSLELLPQNNDNEKLLSFALMTGNIETAIDICLRENRSGEAVILAVSSGRQDLYDKVQNKILKSSAKLFPTSHLISIAVKRNWCDLVSRCDLKEWRESLAWILTYASPDELTDLCEIIAQRLEERSKDDNDYLFGACICYICCGSIDNFVRCWLHCKSVKNSKDLQRLVEMIILLCKSVGDEDFSLLKGEAANILTKYADLIVSQGNMTTALSYLGENDEENVLILRYRICQHLRDKLPKGIKKPNVPFKIFNVVNSIIKNANYPQSHSFTNQRKISEISLSASTKPMKMNEISNNIANLSTMPHDISKFPKTMSTVPLASNNLQKNIQPSYNPSTFIRPSLNYIAPISTQLDKHQGMHMMPELSPKTMLGNNISSNVQQSNAGVHQKSSWNDPPLLSENYRRMYIQNKLISDNKTDQDDLDKTENESPQQFYNPANFISESLDLSINANKLYSTSNLTTTQGQPVNVQSEYNNTNKGVSDIKNAVGNVTELSPERQHWKMSFYNLIELCKERDTSRQTKVKMNEIQKKIDHLFDLLKTQSLSAELINGLDALILLVDSKNYRESLNKVNQIIQTVNFSEAGSFLPSLKMLIQCVIKVDV